MPPSAGSWLIKREGRLGFLPKTSWLGLLPCKLLRVFLVLTAHDSATSKLYQVSSNVFLTISPRAQLCLSFNPLLQGDRIAVVRTTITTFWAMSRKNWLSNSLVLSVKKAPGTPKYTIHYLKLVVSILELSLLGSLTPMQYLVKPFVSFNLIYVHSYHLVEVSS